MYYHFALNVHLRLANKGFKQNHDADKISG